MKTTTALALALCVGALSATGLRAATYNGNGDTSFGGAVGNGSLAVTDNGTDLTFTLTRGLSGDLNDVLVIYLDTAPGGISDTSGLTDTGDGARKAISGFNGGTDRSVLSFTTGFLPEYAVTIEGGFASLFQIVSGGSHNWITGTGQSGSTSATFSLTLGLSNLGINAGDSFNLFGSYIAGSAWRSTEAIAGNGTGSTGYNPFSQSSYETYTTIPEPSSVAFLGLAGLALIGQFRRRD
ncbi:MAG TPA: PEP-CTERM sorting domain-containing protein [Verrucomicrobiota bacterium]|nr:PEP-CTERM sorting domain-containing protein [Verrucomicrobiota bacterium]